MKTSPASVAAALVSLALLSSCAPSSTPSSAAGQPAGKPAWSNPYWNSLPARAQVRLRQFGFYHGPINGKLDAATTDALTRYQESRKLKVTGRLDPWTMRALRL